jgi:hypothetical protein
MIYRILTSLFLLSKISAFSQYLKIPIDTNYFWKQISIATPSISNCSYNYQIRYTKDTIVNSKIYNKYSIFGATTGNSISPCNPNHIKHGYLRQDTIAKKVFILDNNFGERPLYNFSKMIGDTMQIYQFNLNANITVTVTMRDSTMFGDGKYHRRQWAINSTYGNSIYEGMGAATGGLYAHNYGGYIPYTEGITCFGKIIPFSPFFGSSSSSCYLSYVGLKDNFLLANNLIKTYPSPVIDKLTIDFENATNKKINCIILNSLGQIVYSLDDLKNKQQMDLTFLSCGIYYLKIIDGSSYQAKKIIKE